MFEVIDKPGVLGTSTYLDYETGEEIVINLPATVTLTALKYRDNYSVAYAGIDSIEWFSDTWLEETTGWEDLKDDQATDNWEEDHSVLLT